jgi:hypothetical protein
LILSPTPADPCPAKKGISYTFFVDEDRIDDFPEIGVEVADVAVVVAQGLPDPDVDFLEEIILLDAVVPVPERGERRREMARQLRPSPRRPLTLSRLPGRSAAVFYA